MRPLKKALQEHELIVLRVMGEWYDLDLTGEDKAACVRELAEALEWSRDVVERALVQLMLEGRIERDRRGRFRLA